MKPSDLRFCAATIIDSVANGESLTDCLEPQLKKITDSRDRAFVQAVCYGICRYYFRLDILLSYLLNKPMNAKDSNVHALLLVGLYQLLEMRIPAHAAVSETVNAAEKLKQPWAKGFINAILREFLRQKDEVMPKVLTEDEAKFAHADWWMALLKKAWPNEWQAILEASNTHPTFALRVNTNKISRDEYLKLLETENIKAHEIKETRAGIILDTPLPVEQLPGFSDGQVSVQDGAAQLAAEILELAPHLRVLDACAAPGGKLTQLFEVEPQLDTVIAIEKDSHRINLIKENIKRLSIALPPENIICNDASKVESWWDGKLFDRILLDAPCSASGIVRRHPDIKLLRQPQDVLALAKTQLKLLNALWPLLKPNGLFVYVTCSIFPEENSNVLKQFFIAKPDAKEEILNVEWGVHCEYGRQILPHQLSMDGFYFIKIRKVV